MAVWKFHSPFLDDVKQKGLVPALLYKTNEAVERLTAGLDIEDIRSVFRGDPAPRTPKPPVPSPAPPRPPPPPRAPTRTPTASGSTCARPIITIWSRACIP